MLPRRSAMVRQRDRCAPSSGFPAKCIEVSFKFLQNLSLRAGDSGIFKGEVRSCTLQPQWHALRVHLRLLRPRRFLGRRVSSLPGIAKGGFFGFTYVSIRVLLFISSDVLFCVLDDSCAAGGYGPHSMPFFYCCFDHGGFIVGQAPGHMPRSCPASSTRTAS